MILAIIGMLVLIGIGGYLICAGLVFAYGMMLFGVSGPRDKLMLLIPMIPVGLGVAILYGAYVLSPFTIGMKV